MRILLLSFLLISQIVNADSIKSYINIVNNIPQMEIKADPQAQVWARSARNVLTITNESIAETIIKANELARERGKPFFCLPAEVKLDAAKLNDLIRETYQEMASKQSDKGTMTISEVAWIGVLKHYPCNVNSQNNTSAERIQSVLGSLNN